MLDYRFSNEEDPSCQNASSLADDEKVGTPRFKCYLSSGGSYKC